VLDDGSYEGLVVDVGAGNDGVVVLSIVVTDGAHKGDVVDVRSASLHDDGLDMLGMPCVLTVAGGEPSVIFD
jgi:hypothetical protein